MQRYILTDAGNVLATFKFRAQLIEEIMASFGVINVNHAELFGVEGETDIKAEQYYHGLDIGQFSVRDIWQGLVNRHLHFRHQCPYELFFSLWCRHLEPIKGVMDLYGQLQERFPLVVISNGDTDGVRHLLHHIMGSYGLRFEEIFISAERRKKKPELFHDVVKFLEKKKVLRHQCVFIDDLEPYVHAAKAWGIQGIQFNGSQEPVKNLQRALAERGFC